MDMIKVARADLANPRGMISSTLAETPLSDSAILQDIRATTNPMIKVFNQLTDFGHRGIDRCTFFNIKFHNDS